MNIFKLDEKEFDKKIDEIVDNIDPNTLLKELISCGLKIENKAEYTINNTYFMGVKYDYSIEITKKSFWDKLWNKKEEVTEKLGEAA